VGDDGTVGALVRRARDGEEDAWNGLVERFSPLVASVCRRFGLAEPDLLDVGQSVWLALLEHLGDIRETQALAGWIATTTRRECLHVVARKGARQRLELVGEFDVPVGDLADDVTDLVVTAERYAALREAFRALSPQHQQLVLLLMHDPPLPYVEIGRRLGIAVGSIGPIRGRCIDRLRAHPAVRALIEPEAATTTRETGRAHDA
jgi:RNA polymerase sigma factor (sigma-70 family)